MKESVRAALYVDKMNNQYFIQDGHLEIVDEQFI